VAVTRLTPQRPVFPDPNTAHLRRQPMGRCLGCGAIASASHLLHTDDHGDDWHADCYVAILQTSPPRRWRLGRGVLPFVR
jgi:hypothetical protein